MHKFENLRGKIFPIINVNVDEIFFVEDNGNVWRLFHGQDCCESVTVEDVAGDIDDIVNTPVLVAEERVSHDADEVPGVNLCESFTWTFYELRTIKGSVTIRWLGESNGYYSESVEFEKVKYKYSPKNMDLWETVRGSSCADHDQSLDFFYREYFKLGGR